MVVTHNKILYLHYFFQSLFCNYSIDFNNFRTTAFKMENGSSMEQGAFEGRNVRRFMFQRHPVRRRQTPLYEAQATNEESAR